MARKVPTSFNLEFKPEKHRLGYQTFTLGVTTVSDVRGDSLSTYELLPVLWARRLIDAAQLDARFLETVRQETVPAQNDQLIIPIRKKYTAESSFTTSSEPTSDITATDISTPDGVAITPTDYNALVSLSYKAIDTNAISLVQYCKDELMHFYQQKVDSVIRNYTMGDSNSTEANLTAAPTPMSNSVNGAQTIFGGDADASDDSLATGDTLTTDMISKAIRMLSSDIGYYWSNTTTHSKSAVSKNPWTPSAQEPFVLFIAPEQREALQNDSQFTNAAEYGSNEVVLNGEIGNYLGVKVICTHKCTSFTDGDYIYLDGTINPLMNVDGHICMLAKAQRYGIIAFRKKAQLKVFDYPTQAQMRILLSMAFGAKELHPDAIVRLVVSDA